MAVRHAPEYLAALALQRRGNQGPQPLEHELRQLKRKNARLAQRLAQAEALIEVQEKLSALLEMPLPDDDRDAPSEAGDPESGAASGRPDGVRGAGFPRTRGDRPEGSDHDPT